MIDVIKQLALDAIDKGTLSDFCVGTVTAASPLSICLEQGLEIPASFLVLTREVTDYEERGRIKYWTRDEPHEWCEYRMEHPKALKAGERVLLLKASGAQQYVVIDRMMTRE